MEDKNLNNEEPMTKSYKEDQQVVESHISLSSHSSPSTPSPTDSSPKVKKLQLNSKKIMVPKKPRSIKSKGKQVKSDHPRKAESIKRKRTTVDDIYDDVEAKLSVKERAERVFSSLSGEFPCFMKCMLPSNVSHGFWLHLPKPFCNAHLPSHDTTIILVDEWGNEYKTSYLLSRNGLSAGWRGFSISHRLLKGDRLIFRLIEPSKLEVNIVRVNGQDVVDAALCLMNLLERSTDPDLAQKDKRRRRKAKWLAEPFLLEHPKQKEHVQNDRRRAIDLNVTPSVDCSENNSEDLASEVVEGSDVTNHPQYNEMCCSKTSFLHDQPPKGVTCR